MLRLDTNSQNIWNVAIPQKPVFNSAHSPVKAIFTDTVNSYPINQLAHFDMAFEVPYIFGIIISFKHQYNTDKYKDGGFLEISYDNGASWNANLADNTLMFNTENYYTQDDTLIGNRVGFSGDSNGWIDTKIQMIWAFPVRSSFPYDSLHVRFNFVSDSIQTNKDGWIIDDFKVSYAELPGSVAENGKNNYNIQIAPNPIENTSTISFENESADMLQIAIIDYLGKKIAEPIQTKEKQIQWDKNNLKPGVYFIQISNSKGLLGAEKIVVK